MKIGSSLECSKNSWAKASTPGEEKQPSTCIIHGELGSKTDRAARVSKRTLQEKVFCQSINAVTGRSSRRRGFVADFFTRSEAGSGEVLDGESAC